MKKTYCNFLTSVSPNIGSSENEADNQEIEIKYQKMQLKQI